jgi:hypothetical protein
MVLIDLEIDLEIGIGNVGEIFNQRAVEGIDALIAHPVSLPF